MSLLPRISIVIPSYNKGLYIKKTIDSIVDQKYKNTEVIIQDGGSTDESVSIIKKYARKYPKIIKWVSKKDKGQVDAINKGMKKARGEILAYINADDVFKKDAFIKVGEYYKKNPKTSWLVGGGDIIDAEGKKISRLITYYKNFLLKLNYYPLLLSVNYIMQPSVFISKKTYKKYGPFTGTKEYVLEYEMWLKLGKEKMPAILDNYLSSFRLAMGNISTTSYSTLLKKDFDIAKKFTNNPLILMVHKLNNIGRVLIVKYL